MIRLPRFSSPFSIAPETLECSREEARPSVTVQGKFVSKIAIYLDSLQGYGADRTLVKITNGLAAKGIRVDLVLAQQTNRANQNLHPSIQLFNLESSRRNIIKNVLGLSHYLRVHQPDILFSSIHFNNVTAASASVLAGVNNKLVLRQANINRHQFKSYPFLVGAILGFCTRLSYRKADLIISQSKGMSRDLTDFMKADPRKVKMIYNPTVTPDIFEKAQQPSDHAWFDQKTAPIVVSAGRLKPQKDFMTLIKAFARVKQQIPDLKLVILGEGPQRQELAALVTQLGIADSVGLVGFQKNPYAFIAAADVFVLSSQYEGLPNILIEALALGKKIVATACESGPTEILKYGKYGKLVPVGDIEQMADAITAALEEPCVCLREPQATDDFDQKSQVEKYIQTFSYLLEKQGTIVERSSELKAPLTEVSAKF